MFEAALQRLLLETEAKEAIFCDFEGEAIALSTSARDPWELQVLGAQLAASVLDLQRIARDNHQSERLSLICVTGEMVLLVEALPGGYYVLATASADGLWAPTRRQLCLLVESFANEL